MEVCKWTSSMVGSRRFSMRSRPRKLNRPELRAKANLASRKSRVFSINLIITLMEKSAGKSAGLPPLLSNPRLQAFLRKL